VKNNIKFRSKQKRDITSSNGFFLLRCVPDSSLDNDRPPENSIAKENEGKRNRDYHAFAIAKSHNDIKEGHSSEVNISRIMPYFIVLLAFLILLLSGCGYQFGNVLVSGEHKVYIENIENKGYFSVSEKFEEVLENEFYKGGIKVGTSKSKLTINVLEIKKVPTLFDSNNKPLQYKMAISIDYKLNFKEEILKKGEISDFGFYYPERDEQNSEEDGIREALEKISTKIVQNLLDKW
jgi:hypothetical protein